MTKCDSVTRECADGHRKCMVEITQDSVTKNTSKC